VAGHRHDTDNVRLPKRADFLWSRWKLAAALQGHLNGGTLGTCLAIAADKWNEGMWPIEPGIHERLPIFDKPTRMDNGYGTIAQVDLWASIYVERQLYYGQAPIQKISGFHDHHTGLTIANAFTVGILDPEVVEKTWLKIDKISDAPVRPVLMLQGLMAWVRD